MELCLPSIISYISIKVKKIIIFCGLVKYGWKSWFYGIIEKMVISKSEFMMFLKHPAWLF